MEYYSDCLMFVANRIKELRKANGVSAREISLSIGQNENYINSIENRKSEPSMTGLFYICDYFKITPQQFFEEDNKHPDWLNELNENVKHLNSKSIRQLTDFISGITSKAD